MDFFLEALVLGLLFGLGPCLSTCAPVIVPVIASSAKNYKEGFLSAIIFSAGRILSYAVLGFIFGLFGKELEIYMSGKVIGLFMILLGAFTFFNYHKKCILPKIKVTNYFMLFFAGIVMGFTPCGPMGAALAIAALTHSALAGMFVGITFGIGTAVSPLLIIGILSGAWAKMVARNPDFAKITRYVSGIFLVGLGIVYMLS
jgi:sulfite exporter TauE/SafE